MTMLIAALGLFCAMPMPLAPGERPEDRRIAVVQTPLPEEMLSSLQGPAPVSSFRFVGEPDVRNEWIIAHPGSMEMLKMIRLTPSQKVFRDPFNVRFGVATKQADGAYQFVEQANGGCRIKDLAAQPEPSK